MSRRKRSSVVVEKAERRAAGMVNFKDALDLVDGLNLDNYWNLIELVREKQKDYNTALSNVDHLYNELQAEEKRLSEMSDHMLSMVKVKFGRDSSQYEMAGGVRLSDRRRARRRVEVG